MTLVQRVGNVFRLGVLLVIEILAIGTETLKIASEHLDAFLDDLQAKMTTGKPPE